MTLPPPRALTLPFTAAFKQVGDPYGRPMYRLIKRARFVEYTYARLSVPLQIAVMDLANGFLDQPGQSNQVESDSRRGTSSVQTSHSTTTR